MAGGTVAGGGERQAGLGAAVGGEVAGTLCGLDVGLGEILPCTALGGSGRRETIAGSRNAFGISPEPSAGASISAGPQCAADAIPVDREQGAGVQ